jgi:hypothetical protein
MTSYDIIWTTFLENCKVDDIDLPQTDDKMYEAIKNAVLHFNNRLRDTLQCDDTNEQVSRDLTDDDLLILAHYIRYIFLKNQHTYFINLWQPFQKEIGLKNYKTQVDSLEMSMKMEKGEIEELIMNKADDYL